MSYKVSRLWINQRSWGRTVGATVIARTARGLGAALFAVGLTNSVDAADVAIRLPVKAPASVPYYDWSGLYFGGHVGYSRGSAQVGLGDPDPTSFHSSFGSLSAGVQAGYNHVLPSRVLLGIEGDLSVLNYLSRGFAPPPTPTLPRRSS
jgi:high affinity Mn2+ porin